tara:strand:- start:105 stop:341 length:237 start_codon:yes stop_codon:yes gene_type:complete
MNECKHLMNSDTCISCSDDIKKIRTAEEIVSYYDLNNWEEVPDEDLWEDGEISNNTCMIKIYNNVVADGKWRIIRRIK